MFCCNHYFLSSISSNFCGFYEDPVDKEEQLPCPSNEPLLLQLRMINLRVDLRSYCVLQIANCSLVEGSGIKN